MVTFSKPTSKGVTFSSPKQQGQNSVDTHDGFLGGVYDAARGLGHGFQSGMLLGFDDEIAAGASAIPALFNNDTYSDTYQRELSYRRGVNEAVQEAAPVNSFIGEAAGLVATAPRGVGTTALEVAQQAAKGSFHGGMYGAGKSNADTLGERGKAAIPYAIAGGLAQTVAPLTKQAIPYVNGQVSNMVGKTPLAGAAYGLADDAVVGGLAALERTAPRTANAALNTFGKLGNTAGISARIPPAMATNGGSLAAEVGLTLAGKLPPSVLSAGTMTGMGTGGVGQANTRTNSMNDIRDYLDSNEDINNSSYVSGLDAVNYEAIGIRNLPLSEDYRMRLSSVVSQLGSEYGVTITSAGQPSSGEHRTGSHRHDVDENGVGNTADFSLTYNGSRITPDSHPEAYEKLFEYGAGLFSGIGHYDGFVHMGNGGNQASWGPDKTSSSLAARFANAIDAGRN